MKFKEGEYTDLPCPTCKSVGYEKESRVFIISGDGEDIYKTRNYQLAKCLNCGSILKIEERKDGQV